MFGIVLDALFVLIWFFIPGTKGRIYNEINEINELYERNTPARHWRKTQVVTVKETTKDLN